MLKFHQLVLKKLAITFTLLLLVVGAIVYYSIKEFHIQQSQNVLLQNIELLTVQLDENTNLDLLTYKIKKNLDFRLTIIDLEGNVIAESHKDRATMDNHKYREEIMQANREQYGFIIRHSDTVKRDFLYVAKQVAYKDSKIYLRVAKKISSINEQIFTLGIKIAVVLFFFLLFIALSIYKLNQQVQYEMGKILSFLKALTQKQKPNYISSNFTQEFHTITKLLTKVAQILIKKEKKKTKYTSKLQQANRQKDDIISAISHEFKNPIAVINGYTQTLIEDEDINKNIQKKFLSKINKNGERLTNLIDTLRLSIKLENGKQTINKYDVNLYDLIVDSIESLRLTYPQREIIIEGPKDQDIYVDYGLFGIVITNLVENALKYSEDSVRIEFSKDALQVIDSGIGMNQKCIDKITEKFYRVQENSWNNSLGLGLFLVKNILELHSLNLEINSQENEGSNFKIIL